MERRFALAGARLFDAVRGPRSGTLVLADGVIEAELDERHPLPSGLPTISLEGRLVMPSFCDAHCHLTFVGLQKIRVNLSGARSKAEAIALLRAGLERPDLPQTILAEGWDESTWPPADGMLHRADLDAISRARPLVARRACTHLAVANEAALPFFRSFDRVDGTTGRLYEDAAMKASRVLPDLGEEHERALDAAVETALRLGVTCVHEFGKREDFELFRTAMNAGRLPLRVRFFLRYEEWAARPAFEWTAPGRGDLTIAGVKFFTDGSFGARTAAVSVPYADGGGTGELLWSPAELERAYREVAAAELLTATHAIGDRAVALVADALGASGVRRGRIEHVELVDEPTLAALARRDVQLSMQPNFVVRWAGTGGLYERALGAPRARASNPFRSLLSSGRPLAFGSDSMPMGPLFGLRGAIEHPNPSERLSLTEALAAYTAGGPASVGEAAGTLTPGGPADLVVLDARAFTNEALLSASVEATARDGQWLYVRSGSPLETARAVRPE